jgi:thiol:disulfide interchange protein DsbC
VFTDVDCGYCRKLHSQIAEYNRLGIRVRYAFYPRTGPGTESWHKAEAVWCSVDRQAALTLAKAGKEVPAKPTCGTTPVAHTYELGQELGMRGTPGIFTEHGDYIAGYFAPDRLLQKLKELESAGTG